MIFHECEVLRSMIALYICIGLVCLLVFGLLWGFTNIFSFFFYSKRFGEGIAVHHMLYYCNLHAYLICVNPASVYTKHLGMFPFKVQMFQGCKSEIEPINTKFVVQHVIWYKVLLVAYYKAETKYCCCCATCSVSLLQPLNSWTLNDALIFN
jgi:hypothetical protein